MPMPVGVRSRIRHGWIALHVDMLMMLIVCVRVIVLQQLMPVLVLVSLRKMQPHPDAHEDSGNYE